MAKILLNKVTTIEVTNANENISQWVLENVPHAAKFYGVKEVRVSYNCLASYVDGLTVEEKQKNPNAVLYVHELLDTIAMNYAEYTTALILFQYR